MSLEEAPEPLPEKAYATLAIINEIDGKIIPATIAEIVPTPNNTFSNVLMYLKNLKKLMLSGAC